MEAATAVPKDAPQPKKAAKVAVLGPAKRPAVPAFNQVANPDLEAFRTVRQIRLPPRRQQDNYEISDREDDSEAEEPDRSSKHVPGWSKDYLKLLTKQTETDPDSIFSNRVPHVNLDLIFRDEDYLKKQQQRPKRRRGSSGEWKQDRLGKHEVEEYKRKMGQTKRWSTQSPGQPAALGA